MRLLKGLPVLALILATAACSPARVVDDPGGIECESDERWILADIRSEKFVPPHADGNFEVDVTFAANAVDPGFGGVDVGGFGVGITGTNPIVIPRITPKFPSICWPAQYAVALLMRVTLNMTPDVQAGDKLICQFDDGDTAGGELISSQTHEITVTDLIPGAPAVYVECRDNYRPDGYTGEMPKEPGKP